MFCTYCKLVSVDNHSVCPACGSPSPHADGLNQVVPQLSFEDPLLAGQSDQPLSDHPQRENALSFALPAPTGSPWLPVPYQASPTPLLAERQPTLSLQLVPEHALQDLLPDQAAISGAAVHIPPAYPALRPIIPPYRIFSGVLSLLIVCALLCTGAGYYAKASGSFDKAVQLLNGPTPALLISPATPVLPDPPNPSDKDRGAAFPFIPSATMTQHIDANEVPIQPEKIFKVAQVFYLTFSVLPPPKMSGKVFARWYTDGLFFKSTPLTVVDVAKNGAYSMIYVQPAEGSVELYWNDQFAQRLYFVVRT